MQMLAEEGAVSARLLDEHGDAIVQIHRDSLRLVKAVGIRLKRWIAKADSDWHPTSEFLAAYRIHCNAARGLVAEGRHLERAKTAAGLTDAQIREALRDVAHEELMAMDDMQFLQLIDKREKQAPKVSVPTH
jgi:hypothetical protein